MKALNLDKLDAFMEIEYDGEIYNAYTKNDINDKAINAIPLDRVDEAREKIDELDGEYLTIYDGTNKIGSGKYVYIDEVLEILDKLIESEGE